MSGASPPTQKDASHSPLPGGVKFVTRLARALLLLCQYLFLVVEDWNIPILVLKTTRQVNKKSV